MKNLSPKRVPAGTICANCKHALSPWYLPINWSECALDHRRHPAYIPHPCGQKEPREEKPNEGTH